MSTELDPEVGDQHWLQPWCKKSDLPAARLEALEITDVDWDVIIGAATDLLYVLSGREYRSGRSVVRPCAINSSYGMQSYLYPYSSMSGYGAAWGFAAGWSWTAVGMGWWQNGQDLSELVLQGRVTRINDVIADGQSLGGWEPGQPGNPNYTLYDRRRLVRNATGNPAASNAWPWNQQLQLDLTQGGTFAVDYEWGRKVPPGGKLACEELALNLALVMSGSDDTKLPSRVLNIASQGISVAIGDPIAYIREDLTGLPICDLWLNAVNPQRRRRRPIILAPNSIQGREQPAGPNPFAAY